MGNLVVIIAVTVIITLAIRPIIKYNKSKADGDFGCYGCSCSSTCNKNSCS